ncbi:hypothetical protein HMI54_014410 [Coelomomyces lativittatus]|nr:hypothetical protein HMI54_014410 [Coelomomyces lativittatus]
MKSRCMYILYLLMNTLTYDWDPAIEAWGRMRSNTHEHFRFTPTSSLLTVIFVGIIPYVIYKLETEGTAFSRKMEGVWGPIKKENENES